MKQRRMQSYLGEAVREEQRNFLAGDNSCLHSLLVDASGKKLVGRFGGVDKDLVVGQGLLGVLHGWGNRSEGIKDAVAEMYKRFFHATVQHAREVQQQAEG